MERGKQKTNVKKINMERGKQKTNVKLTNLQPVFIKSFKELALWVPLALHTNSTHKAVRIALLPPVNAKTN
jgi:hypothetical protein